MNIKPILTDFKKRIRPLYGDKFKQLVLFGSWARNQATDDSDIDVAVVLGGQIKPGLEIDRMIDVITDINLESNVLLSVYPVSEDDFRNRQSPLLINIRREGIQA